MLAIGYKWCHFSAIGLSPIQTFLLVLRQGKAILEDVKFLAATENLATTRLSFSLIVNFETMTLSNKNTGTKHDIHSFNLGEDKK